MGAEIEAWWSWTLLPGATTDSVYMSALFPLSNDLCIFGQIKGLDV